MKDFFSKTAKLWKFNHNWILGKAGSPGIMMILPNLQKKKRSFLCFSSTSFSIIRIFDWPLGKSKHSELLLQALTIWTSQKCWRKSAVLKCFAFYRKKVNIQDQYYLHFAVITHAGCLERQKSKVCLGSYWIFVLGIIIRNKIYINNII